jgi:hypothetical protein
LGELTHLLFYTLRKITCVSNSAAAKNMQQRNALLARAPSLPNDYSNDDQRSFLGTVRSPVSYFEPNPAPNPRAQNLALLLRGRASRQQAFDVRENDRNFQVGDMLILREFDPESEQYTGQSITRWVSYVLQGGAFGVQPDWCVLGFSESAPIPTGITDIRLW